MLLVIAITAVIFTVYFFIRDMEDKQIISSRFDSFYRPFRAKTVVQHEYVSKPETIWKALTRFEDYCIWFPGVNRVLPVLNVPRYVHRFSFDRFSIKPGAYIKIRPHSLLPWFKGRILGLETNKKLELEMRFSPVNKELVTFEINRTPSGSSEVTCQRTSNGLFSFLTTWGFADHGSTILHNLAHFIPQDQTDEKEIATASTKTAGPQLSREATIAQAVQAGMDGNMDLINAIADKPTRGLAKAALVKAKRTGSMPTELLSALSAKPVTAAPPPSISGDVPPFSSTNDLIAFVVNKALDGDMDPINNIPEKPIRGKAKAMLVKAKRTGKRPPLPDISPALTTPAKTPVIDNGKESETDLIARLVAAGVKGNMDEINALDNKVLRGKIKAAIIKAKRAAK